MLSTHELPFSLLECSPPLGLDHERWSAVLTPATPKYKGSTGS